MFSELKVKDFKNTAIKKLARVFDVTITTTGDIHYQFKDKKTGHLILRTKHSPRRKIDKYILHLIRQQLYLSTPQFLDLVNCPMSGENYKKILKGKCIF